MKKKLLLTIVIGCLLFTGCKGKGQPVEPTTSEEITTTAEETETGTETNTDKTTQAATKSESVTESQPRLTDSGIIDDVAMNSIVIKLEDGTLLSLVREGSEIISGDGLSIGDKVEITYEGGQVIKIVEIK